jgi:hypothetical protein
MDQSVLQFAFSGYVQERSLRMEVAILPALEGTDHFGAGKGV